MLKDFLDNKKCLKVVCGAGNNDLDEIKNICAIYSSAGCKFFDVAPSVEAIRSAKTGIEYSGKKGFICVSIGINDDPHFRKYKINSALCKGCKECEKVCIQNAIKNFKIIKDKCIGCALCKKVCKWGAIEGSACNMPLNEILPPLINEGIDCIEYHIITDNEKKIMAGLSEITALYKGAISICLDRSKFGNEKIEAILKKMKRLCKGLFIIQADGAPMSGGKNDYNSTLQAVATADIIDKMNITPYIFISGGTNSKTYELANLCGLNFTGVSIGSYARKIIKKYIENKNLLNEKALFEEALEIAKTIFW